MIRYSLQFTLLFVQLACFPQEYDAVLERQETNIVINRGKLTKTIYYKIRINNRAGEKFTKVTIPYSKINKVRNIQAYIINSNGEIIKRLKKRDIVDKSSISDYSLYEDYFVKEFTIRHNSYPYSIVYSYQTRQKDFLYIDFWVPVLDTRTPTLSAVLNVTAPLDYNISYSSQHIIDSSIKILDKHIDYQWSTSFLNTFRSEAHAPQLLSLLPTVEITPLNFKYELEGSFKDWQSYGNWQYELLQGINNLPDSEKRSIERMISDVESNSDRIRKLYHYIQDNTRYINITIETGGLKPYPASYVAQNKYGDCKALTNYFKSMLDYIGIESYYTKIYAGYTIRDLKKDFPSQQFNHAILYVPLEDQELWLDCTSKSAFNYIGTSLQNREALIIDKDNSRFIKTPSLDSDDVLEVRKILIRYSSRIANLSFHNTYKGSMYEVKSQLDQHFNESDRNRIVRNNYIEDGVHLLNYEIINQHRDSTSIEFSYDGTSHNIYHHLGNNILINIIPFSIPSFENPNNRKLPVKIDYPLHKIDTIVYEIPKGYVLNNSVNHSISSKYGEYDMETFEKNDNIWMIKKMLINRGNYCSTEYESFYHFYKQIHEIETKTKLSLSKKQ